MNEQKRTMRKKRTQCDTRRGIMNILIAKGTQDGLDELRRMRTELAEEICRMPGANPLRMFVIDSKWFLTVNGEVNEITFPPLEVLPKKKDVMRIDKFMRCADITRISGKLIT